MVVRHKVNKGWKLAAAFLAGSLVTTGTIRAQEVGDGLPVPRKLPPIAAAKAHSTLSLAIEAQRKGDYETAAKLFREAGTNVTDLTATERAELGRLTQANQEALRQRKEAESTLATIEKMLSQGQTSSASDLLKRIEANEQFLSADGKAKYSLLQDEARAGKSSIVTAELKTTSAKKGESASKARVLVAEGRTLTLSGRFEMAEAKVREAESCRATFAASEDSPAKLREDIQKSKADARFLLAAGHMALLEGDYDLAEKLAKSADRAAGPLTFRFALDNPTRLIKEIQEAKKAKPSVASRNGSRPANPEARATEKGTIVQVSAKDKVEAAKVVVVDVDPSALNANADSEAECRKLVGSARAALGKGDLLKARQLAEKAKATKSNLPWWDDTPERILGEIQRADAAINTVNEAAAKLTPSEQLKIARQMFASGKLEEAIEMVMKLKANQSARWGLFEDNPDRLRGEIEKALTKRNQGDSVKVLAEARKLFETGEYEKATRAAYRAQTLHGPYSIWELGDRPQKLIAQIEASRLSRKVNAKIDSSVNKATDSINLKVDQAQNTVAKTNDKVVGKVNETINQVNGATQVVGGEIDNAIAKADGTIAGLTVPPLPPIVDRGAAAKGNAAKLIEDAQILMASGKIVEARAKAIQAQKLSGVLPNGLATPEEILAELNRKATKQVATNLDRVGDIANKGGAESLRSAQAELDRARQVARDFGLDQGAIDAKATWLKTSFTKENGKDNLLVSGPLAIPALPIPALPIPALGIPALPMEGAKVGLTPVPLNVAAGDTAGKVLLEKARLELRSGQTTNARRLAEEAFQGPYGVKEDASALLRTIDNEDSNQRSLEAKRTFDAAIASYNRKEYSQALAIFAAVSDKYLDKGRLARKREIMQSPALVALTASDVAKPLIKDGAIAKVNLGAEGPPTTGETKPAPDLIEAAQAIKEVKFSQLRQQGLDAQREAAEKFRVGQTDVAAEILQDYLAMLGDQQIEANKLALLKRPVESRLQHFKLLKAQKEFLEKDNVVRDTKKNSITQKQLADDNKQKKVSEQMKLFNQAFKEGKYLEAESYAMRAHELDPDNSMAAAAMQMAKTQRNINVAKTNKSDKERFFLEGLNDTDKVGPSLTIDKPLDAGVDSADKRNKRTISMTTLANPQRKTAADREIESRLNTPVNINFKDTSLREALEDLRKYYNINIVPDVAALEDEGVSLDRPITLMLEQVSLKSALNLMLRSAHLTYVIKDEVLLITTESQARGKLNTVTYQVTDLITPVENFGSTKPGSNLTNRGATKGTMGGSSSGGISGNNATPIQSPFSLSGGQPTGSPAGGSFQGGSDAPQFAIGKKASQTTEDTLIKLITATINPQSWNSVGGPGSIEFFPLTNSLVINQTPDIQEQVQDLLNNLRRLLDQEVAIEIRFISIAEDFYERIGVDFNMNIKTDRNTSRFEPQITSNTYKPAGFINDPNMKGMVGGLTSAGTFTTDLDIPIAQSSFALTNPVFGGYPGLPGSGGINLGLAFLSDIQVFLFLEAAQGDKRTNVMQAPKITMFNGQTSALGVFDSQFFLTDVGVTPLANGNITFTPVVTEQPIGFQMSLQAIISADRRVVRLTPSIQLSNLVPGPVQLFPIIVPIFPQTGNLVNPNPSDPITFTQFIQQPVINTLFIQTTVAVPDGGTVLMGGFKRLSESRSEYGPPVLSKIPYLNRLFRNTGYGREATSLLMMVTPRIIIQEEEEFNQTGIKPTFPNNP